MRRIAASSVCLLAAVACAKGPAAGPSDSGVRGIVLLGPMCPVVRVGSPCPDKPISTDLQVTKDGRVVATVRSGEDGRFSVVLVPGDYVLVPAQASPGGLPFARPVTVTVRPHQFTLVKVLFDSGIRSAIR